MTAPVQPHPDAASEAREVLPVIQADRDAAASAVPDDGSHAAYMLIDGILSGRMDDYVQVQAFARYRVQVATAREQAQADAASEAREVESLAPAEIERLRELEASATPAPWTVFGGTISDFDREWQGSLSMEWVSNSAGDPEAREAENAAFVVALRNAAPALLSATAREQAQAETIAGLREDAKAWHALYEDMAKAAGDLKAAVRSQLDAMPYADHGDVREAFNRIATVAGRRRDRLQARRPIAESQS
jgi:hypothetical protein